MNRKEVIGIVEDMRKGNRWGSLFACSNNEDEKRSALKILATKYSPDHEQGRLQEIDKQLKQVCLVELAIEYMTGKEAIELVQEKPL